MIAITGTSGFVGKNMSSYFNAKGKTTHAINLRNTNWQSQLPEQLSAIIHLAGKAHDVKNTSNASLYDEVNYELTKQVFDAFKTSTAQYFFFFSSVKAAADRVEGYLDETITPNPKTAYGISKLKAENYILNTHLPEDKRVYIIRPCMIHGEGNKGNLNLLYAFVKKGIPYPLASFNNQRSFISIQNLNYLVDELLKKKTVPSGIYNVADDEVLSTNELIDCMAIARDTKPKKLKLPKSLIFFLAKIGDVFSLPINSERVQKLTENYCVSNSKIKKALGINALPLTAKEGILNTLESFK